MSKGLSKRNFIKNSILGAGALSCGLLKSDLCAVNNNFEFTGHYKPSQIGNQDEFSIEALYYVSTPKGLKCQLCPNDCTMKEGEESDCRTRINRAGILECIAYGNPCAVHIDPIEKKPLYHFLPSSKTLSIATAGCNLACLNCQNWEISQSSPLKTKNYKLMPEEVVKKCLDNNCSSIAYTYSDPIVFYEYVLDTAKIARQEHIKNIIVSAGYINEKPLREWCKYIDAANIDLKSFSNNIYEMLNAGTLEPVLNTIKILREEEVWLEITNLIVPNWTDDLDMIKKMCDWLYDNEFENIPLHFSRFFPQFKLMDLPPTPIDILLKAKQIAVESGIHFVYIGNAPETGNTTTNCPNCNAILVERIGYSVQHMNIANNQCPFCGQTVHGTWE
jgi:pyruvate formate lyase activating enzyme